MQPSKAAHRQPRDTKKYSTPSTYKSGTIYDQLQINMSIYVFRPMV